MRRVIFFYTTSVEFARARWDRQENRGLFRLRGLGLAQPLLVALAACSAESRPAVLHVVPLNGSTAVETSVSPSIEVADGAALDLSDRQVVLYDVTAGARKTVPAVIEVLGRSLTYRPKDPLPADHDFELAMERSALVGEPVDEVDASESPEEPIVWPYRVWFSAKSRPRVRAAYLDRAGGMQRITVHFSQAMDPVATEKVIEVCDLTDKVLAMNTPVWAGSRSVHFDVAPLLDPAMPYTLRIGRSARAEDNSALDGNDDGVPGGPEDDFGVSFTGSQPVIFSRLPRSR
jgi:hypothetical protein